MMTALSNEIVKTISHSILERHMLENSDCATVVLVLRGVKSEVLGARCKDRCPIVVDSQY
jgi:hypothetical protein